MLLANDLLANASRLLCGWGPHLDAAGDDQVVADDGTYMVLPCRRTAPADSHLQTEAASNLTQVPDGEAARNLTQAPDGEARQRLLVRLPLADSSGGTAAPQDTLRVHWAKAVALQTGHPYAERPLSSPRPACQHPARHLV